MKTVNEKNLKDVIADEMKKGKSVDRIGIFRIPSDTVYLVGDFPTSDPSLRNKKGKKIRFTEISNGSYSYEVVE